MSVIAYESSNTLVIGQVQHYHFYQSINQSIINSNNNNYRSLPTLTNKCIIPSTPRQRSNKAPINSPLSFIREQKIPTNHTNNNNNNNNNDDDPSSDLFLSSSPSLLTSSLLSSTSKSSSITLSSIPSSIDLFKLSSSSSLSLSSLSSPFMMKNKKNKRKRKVSFDENVMVICTQFVDDDHLSLHSHYHRINEENEENEENDDNDEEEDDNDNDDDDDEEQHDIKNNNNNHNIIHDSGNPMMYTNDLIYHGRRHSSPGKCITPSKQQQKRWKKFVQSLKKKK
ncbi:unnamed protein product [Cunninghamella blakesleeana]